MSRTVSRRLSIGLAIAGLQICILLIILFCASKGVVVKYDNASIHVPLFNLGFGGNWYYTLGKTTESVSKAGNAFMGTAFVFVCIATIIAGVLLYSIAAKKFLPKTNMILSIILFCLLLSSTIVVCASRVIALSILDNKEISKYMHLSSNAIVYIVFAFIAVGSYITIATIPLIREKVTK